MLSNDDGENIMTINDICKSIGLEENQKSKFLKYISNMPPMHISDFLINIGQMNFIDRLACINELINSNKKLTENKVDDICTSISLNTNQKKAFKKYISRMHSEDRPAFLTKLNNMSNKELNTYLNEFLDTELEEIGSEIYKGSVEPRVSSNDELYQAREASDYSARILLWQAFIKKLSNQEDRFYVYEYLFGLNIDKLIKLKQINIKKYKIVLYKGFLQYIQSMKQSEFERLVELVFEPDSTITELF